MKKDTTPTYTFAVLASPPKGRIRVLLASDPSEQKAIKLAAAYRGFNNLPATWPIHIEPISHRAFLRLVVA